MRYLLFSDVDGTMLDVETYRWDEALPGIECARLHGVPIVFNTSKTEQETRLLGEMLGIEAPFAIENGGAVYVPPGTFDDGREEGLIPLGVPYPVIRAALDELSVSFRFQGISDMSEEEVETACGLPSGAMAAARERRFSEPLVWRDEPERMDEFAERLRSHGLTLKRGDRFVHVMGATDKRVALEHLVPRYRRRSPEAVSVALGNGPNDLDMMAAADIAVVINNPGGRNIQYAGARVPEGTGPAAWSRAVQALLEGCP